MIRDVRVAGAVHKQVHDRYGEARGVDGQPSEYDFVSGPLAAAVFAFRDFDELGYDLVPSVRHYTIVDPVFGAVVFVGIATSDEVVEIVDFSDDPDYWSIIEENPE